MLCQSPHWPRARRKFLRAVGWLPLVSLASTSGGRAEERTPRGTPSALEIRAEGAGCPDAALLESQLEPLLSDHPLAEGDEGELIVTVIDRGPRYEVLVAEGPRVVEDPGRDCLERARAAAVLIVLAMGTERPEEREPDERAPPKDARPTDSAREAGSSFLLQLLGGLESTRELSPAPGAALGVVLSRGPWRAGLSLGVVAPVTIGVDDEGGRFRLLRLPALLTGAHLWDLGDLQLGPGLGLVVEGLRFQGVDTPAPTGGWRWNVGAAATLTGRKAFGANWAVVLEARAAVFPRAYEAWVEPDRGLGATPQWWLGTYLGVERVLGRTTGPY